MAECILESGGGGSVREIEHTADGAFRSSEFKLEYPGMAGCMGNGSNMYITFPGLVTEQKIVQDTVFDVGNPSADDPEYTLFHSDGSVEELKPTIANRTKLLLYSKNVYRTGTTGYIKEPEFCLDSLDAEDWRVPQNGIVSLKTQNSAFPAIQMNDRIVFAIPFLAAWPTNARVLSPRAFARFFFSKIGSTYFTFYRRAHGSTTKLNAVNMNIAGNYKMETASYGVRVEYTLPSATGIWTAGIVSTNNLSYDIKLLLMMPENERGEGVCRGTGWNYEFYNNSSISYYSGSSEYAYLNFRSNSISTSQYIWCYSQEPVDLTGVSYIFIPSKHSINNNSNYQNSVVSGNNGALFGVCSSAPTSTAKYSSFKKYVTVGNRMPDYGVILDVSSLSGEYYPAFCIWIDPNTANNNYYHAYISLSSFYMI